MRYRGMQQHTPSFDKTFSKFYTDTHGYVSVEIRQIRVISVPMSGAVHRKARKERKAEATKGIRKKSAFIHVHLRFVIFHCQWLHG